jgi:pimeloyl-ACP methyl ester carboxylesterase
MIDSQIVDTPSGKLHVRVIGVGRPVLLLHGFPDSSLGFRTLCEALARAGFRAIAPDMRGYGLSDKPQDVASYRSAALLEDIAALVRWTGEPSVDLVGHDWGGTFAYCFAAQYPEQVRRLVIMNAPHPDSYAAGLKRGFQLLRSWYLLLFQLRGLAEWLVTRPACFRWLLRRLTAQPALLSDGQIEAARRELCRPGVPRAAMAYYRAALRWPIRCRGPITAPTLVLWGERDPALDVRLLADLPRHVAELSIQRFEHAGHFVHWDEPDRVLAELVRFLSS